jgi:hypothetical protein
MFECYNRGLHTLLNSSHSTLKEFNTKLKSTGVIP